MSDDKPPSTGVTDDTAPEDPGPDRVLVSDEQDVPLDTGAIATMTARALAALGVPDQAEVSVTFVDAPRMAELKEQALGERAPTDVLSFPLDDLADPMPGPVMLGDIVICPTVARRHARALGRTLEAEISQLLVHGLLHLLGVDHDGLRAEQAMVAEERRVLAVIGGAAA